ncbi:MAG: hypothetical protein J6K15_03070 [Lachnospiraceae bacterium]|nr:hypothetical protein [Lachnospiraceae bacterium]
MTETIYEKRPAELQNRRRLPNNRRQIGQPGMDTPEVFIEDYAFSFAKSLSERDYTGCVVGVLVGECMEGEQGDKILVRGVLEARDVLLQDTICFTEDNWAGIYRDIRDFFPTMQIVGWFLGGPGFLLEDTERQKKIQEDNFGGKDKILLKMDSSEKEQRVFGYQDGEMKELPGYYIYYERNAEMQNYMAGTNRIFPKKAERHTEEIQQEQTVVKTQIAEYSKNKGSFYQLFYATGGILTCIAILVIAGLAMQIQERNRLQDLINKQEQLVSSIQMVYVAEEGETVESVCMKFYGTTEKAEAIRMLNGLSADEELMKGQKIFLP